ncbi:hypothetical protein AB1Y20_008914 [Prymnesium parvum]|uniref:Uncharacterized protein n=1 Tax=Prymnesium parvum TaxID=97485 RepID=A0AB34K0L3_PRYPA
MPLAAGVPALIALAGSVGAGSLLASVSHALHKGDHPPLAFLFIVQLAVALVFWGWAVYNCITKQFDLGAVSFATVIAATALGLRRMDASAKESLQKQRVLTGLSGLFVVVNYALGIGVASTKAWTLLLYMVVACTLWCASTIAAVLLLSFAIRKCVASASLLPHGE